MRINDIYTAFVSWPGGGKRRPVLVLKDHGVIVEVFKITIQFAQKSAYIQSRYFKIEHWKEAGLAKQSYIDTIEVLNLNKEKIKFHWVGSLTSEDIDKFSRFLDQLF